MQSLRAAPTMCDIPHRVPCIRVTPHTVFPFVKKPWIPGLLVPEWESDRVTQQRGGAFTWHIQHPDNAPPSQAASDSQRLQQPCSPAHTGCDKGVASGAPIERPAQCLKLHQW